MTQISPSYTPAILPQHFYSLISTLSALSLSFYLNYMNKLKVTKLKMTPTALGQLQQLRLSLADLDLIICFSRKLCRSDMTLYQFDPTLIPATIQPRLVHLAGLTLRIISGEVVEVYRDTQAFFDTEETN